MTDTKIGPTVPGRFDRKAATLAPSQPLKRRLLLGEKALPGFTPVLHNPDVVVSFFSLPGESASEDGFSNGDGDDLFYFYEGEGTLESPFGDLPVRGGDYLAVPRGVVHRLRISSPFEGILFELRGGLHIPREFRNPVGQLRMDAPYSHRDFGRPVFIGPRPGPTRILVKKDDHFVERFPAASPFDVVGWDGTVWPFAFDILKYQAKTGLVHLPPTIHSTFAGRNALICSFVPRVTDTHPDAIPCPYPHTSVDCDEVIYYVRGQLHEPSGCRAEGRLAPPRRRAARPAPRQLRGLHRLALDGRAGRDDGHLPPAPSDEGGARPRARRLPRQLEGLTRCRSPRTRTFLPRRRSGDSSRPVSGRGSAWAS